jgi:hypothetical protein
MVVDDVIQLKLFELDDFLERPETIYQERGYVEILQRGGEKHQVQCRGIEDLCAVKYSIDRWILSGLHDEGVLLLLGTDSGTGGMGIVPGFSIHVELLILIENGFTPYEALAAGTRDAASVVGNMTGRGDFGTIEVGNRADLILVRVNPFEDITTIQEPLGVMAAGQWFDRNALDLLIAVPDIELSEQ